MPESEVFSMIKTLTEVPGPVGREDVVQDWIEERWRGFASEVRRTKVDNVLARIGGSGERLLLLAHADEICYVVRSITDDGFVSIWPYYRDMVGRPQKTMMPLYQPASIITANGIVEGIFATASGHVPIPNMNGTTGGSSLA